MLFELALALGMTVSQLEENLSYGEYRKWIQFFQLRPYGWREDNRAFKIMSSSGNLEKGSTGAKYFASLSLMEEAERKERASRPVPTRGSHFHSLLMKAKGGDKPEFLREL